jgi:hypothetical protein
VNVFLVLLLVLVLIAAVVILEDMGVIDGPTRDPKAPRPEPKPSPYAHVCTCPVCRERERAASHHGEAPSNPKRLEEAARSQNQTRRT